MAIFNVANFPLTEPLTDEKGVMSKQWQNVFRSVYNLVGNNFNEQGVTIPALDSVDTVKSPTNGVIIYSNDEDKFKKYESNTWVDL